MPLTLKSSPHSDDDEVDMPKSPKLLVTQETQTPVSEQYHPPADKLKVRKTRHRRNSSQGSCSYNSPRLSPMRERRISSPRRRSYNDSYQEPIGYPSFILQREKSTSSLNGNLTGMKSVFTFKR